MSRTQTVYLDPLSGTSLYLEAKVRKVRLASATGFVVSSGNRYYLVTNYHVVSGKGPNTGDVLSPTGEIPDELYITHHAKGRLGSWVVRTEALYKENGEPCWIEHPAGSQIDVVALPLENIDDSIALYPLDLTLANSDVRPEPGMTVFIVGYPLGLAVGGHWPIWKTGNIASDPDLDFKDLPAFIIDATTRGGMSGSPVVIRTSGGYRTRSGGMFRVAGPSVTLFLGVFSAHIEAAEIGVVWRVKVIDEILKQATA